MKTPKLSSLLKTIQEIQEIYPFKAEETFVRVDEDPLSRLPIVELKTLDVDDNVVTISRKVRCTE